LDASLTTLLCKRNTVAKFEEVKNRSNVAEFSKGGHGSKSVVLLMMVLMMMKMHFNIILTHKTYPYK
jgi:hypothetical protein